MSSFDDPLDVRTETVGSRFANVECRIIDQSVEAKSGWLIMAMNMVGTPLKVVIRSWLMQARAGLGEK